MEVVTTFPWMVIVVVERVDVLQNIVQNKTKQPLLPTVTENPNIVHTAV